MRYRKSKEIESIRGELEETRRRNILLEKYSGYLKNIESVNDSINGDRINESTRTPFKSLSGNLGSWEKEDFMNIDEYLEKVKLKQNKILQSSRIFNDSYCNENENHEYSINLSTISGDQFRHMY